VWRGDGPDPTRRDGSGGRGAGGPAIPTQNEGQIIESLSREKALRPFVPQFMGYVEREGRTYIKNGAAACLPYPWILNAGS